jgi:hypothetical protein
MCGRVRLSSDVSEIKLVFSILPHLGGRTGLPDFGGRMTYPRDRSGGSVQEVSSPTPMNSKEYFDREVKLYEIYRDYIKAEDLLRSSRTTAFLAIQGLLFTAIGVSLGTGQAEHPPADRVTLVNYFRLIIFGAGLLTCLHMLLRDNAMRRVAREIDKRIKAIKKRSQNVPDELANFAEENAFWLNHLPKWHYESSLPLRIFSFHHILALAWAGIGMLIWLLWH